MELDLDGTIAKEPTTVLDCMTRLDPREEGPTRVAVRVSNPKDSRVIEAWLDEQDPFERVDPDQLEATTVDSRVLDERALQADDEALRTGAAPPTLLITSTDDTETSGQTTATIGDATERADAVVASPVEPAELAWRLGALRERARQQQRTTDDPIDAGRRSCGSDDQATGRERERELNRYKYAVERAPEMLIGVDTERRVCFTNERLREFLGRTTEIEGETLESILDETTLTTVDRKVERALGGETIEDVIVEEDALGRERVLDIRFYPLELGDGSIIGAAAAIRDVTEREQQRERLARFRRAVEAAGHAIYITDVDGTIEYVNPAFEATTGYSARAVRGETPQILNSGEMSEDYYEQLWETVLSGGMWQERILNRRASGELYHADQTIAPITGPDGSIDAFVAIQTDVTERVETKSNLETYEAIVQRLDDPIMLQDREGQYVVVNDALAEYAGLDREALLGSNEFAFMDERTAAIINREKQRVLDEQRPITYEVEPRLPNGSAPTFRTTRYPHYDSDGSLVGTIAICRDMTDVQERERQLQVLDRLLRHNLRNKMTVIFGQADRIAEASSGDTREAAQRILQAGADIVALSETEREMIDVFENHQPRRPIVLHPVLERLRSDLAEEHPDASISIECNPDVQAKTIPQVEQAIREVLENAIEHTADRSPEITVTVTPKDDGVRITVADNGPGMPAAERAVLAENAEITPLVHGSGLGLWLVHHVVTQSGGSLDFHENDPQGSVVEMRLPNETASEANR